MEENGQAFQIFNHDSIRKLNDRPLQKMKGVKEARLPSKLYGDTNHLISFIWVRGSPIFKDNSKKCHFNKVYVGEERQIIKPLVVLLMDKLAKNT